MHPKPRKALILRRHPPGHKQGAFDILEIYCYKYPMPRKTHTINLHVPLYEGGPTRIEWLCAQMRDKDIGPYTLIMSLEDCPPGLSTGILCGWVRRYALTARPEHWAAIEQGIEAYEKKRLDLTERPYTGGPNRTEWLRKKMEEKSVGSQTLFNSLAIKPDGLTRHTINSWNQGLVTTASWDHWIAVKHGIRAYQPPETKTGRPVKKHNKPAAPALLATLEP